MQWWLLLLSFPHPNAERAESYSLRSSGEDINIHSIKLGAIATRGMFRTQHCESP